MQYSSLVGELHKADEVIYLTIRLWARDFYELIVDEAEGRINYHPIEIYHPIKIERASKD